MQGRPFWSETRRLQEFTNQLGTQNGFRVTSQNGHNWNSSWTYTVGIPTGVWVKMWNREHKLATKLFAILAYRAIRRTFAGLNVHGSPTNFYWNWLPAKQRKSWEANILASVSRIPICNFFLHQSIWFQLVILSCWLVFIRVWITVASTFPSDSEHMLHKNCHLIASC